MTFYIRIEKDSGALDITNYFKSFTVSEKMDLITFRATAKKDILNILSPGDKIKLFLDEVSPPAQPRNIYVVESIEDIISSKYKNMVRITGREDFYSTALNKVVAEVYQYRQVENIFQDLIAKYTSWTPKYHETDIAVDNVSFNYIPLYDALKTLMELSATYLEPNTNNEIWLKIRGSINTGITYTDSDFKPGLGFTQALDELKNIIYVVGSEDFYEDQTQLDTSGGYYQTDTQYLAVSFIPERSSLRQISIYMEKIGLPQDLQGKIVKDNNGSPTGEIMAYFTYNRNYVGGAGWYPTSVQAQLDTGQKYWIVFELTGDTNNHYRLYHGVSGEYAYSTDGSTWTVGTGAIAYKTYYGIPVIVKVSDEQSIQQYGAREEVVKDDSIRDRRTARTLASQILEKKSKIRSDFGEITVYTNKVPRPGELISISSTRFNISNTYIVSGVKIELQGGYDKYAAVQLDLGPEKSYLEQMLREIYSDLRKVKHKDIDVLRTELNKYVGISDDLTQSDSQTVTVLTSGQFKYDDSNAKYGFSDYG